MGIFAVVIWNPLWLNPKKHREVNKQNRSSHLNTGTCKLGESNWKSRLFWGQADTMVPRTHNLPLWHWAFIRPSFCSMISLVTWVGENEHLLSLNTQVNLANLLPLPLHLPLPDCWNLTKYSLILHGVSRWFFSHADGNHFLKMYTWQEEMFSRKSRCLENGFPFVLSCPSPNPNHFCVNKLTDYNVALTFHNWCQWHFNSSTYEPAKSRRKINLQFGKKLGEQPKQLGGRRRKLPKNQTKAHCTDVTHSKTEKHIHSWSTPANMCLGKKL